VTVRPCFACAVHFDVEGADSNSHMQRTTLAVLATQARSPALARALRLLGAAQTRCTFVPPSLTSSYACSGVDVDGAQLYLHDGVCLTGAACPAGTFANEGARASPAPEASPALTLLHLPPAGDKTCSSCVARYGEDAASCTADEVTACTDGDRFNGGCIESCPHNVGVLVGALSSHLTLCLFRLC